MTEDRTNGIFHQYFLK